VQKNGREVAANFEANGDTDEVKYSFCKTFAESNTVKSEAISIDVSNENVVVVLDKLNKQIWEEVWEEDVIPERAFIACSTFDHARAGYVFKMGPEGLGYYPDDGPFAVDASQEKNSVVESTDSPGELLDNTSSPENQEVINTEAATKMNSKRRPGQPSLGDGVAGKRRNSIRKGNCWAIKFFK